jgi:hypothetical protein
MSAQAQYSRSCQNLRYYSSLDTWTVVRLNAAKFKPLIFSVSGFVLPYIADISIFMILYNFCLLPALFCNIIVNVRNIIACLPCSYETNRIWKDTSNNYSIVACVSVTAVMSLSGSFQSKLWGFICRQVRGIYEVRSCFVFRCIDIHTWCHRHSEIDARMHRQC